MPEVTGETIKDLARIIQTTNDPWAAEAASKKMLQLAKEEVARRRARRRERIAGAAPE